MTLIQEILTELVSLPHRGSTTKEERAAMESMHTLTHFSSNLPIEYKLLRIQPIRWEPAHVTGFGQPGMVAMSTGFGVNRIIDMPVGEQLPRIC